MERDEALNGPGTGVGRAPGPTGPASLDRAWLWPAAGAVLRRPHLWLTALAQLGRMAVPGWWRRWPPLPVPDPHYLAFRLQTQYGDPGRAPVPEDLVTYLEWCRRFRRSMG